MGTSPLYATDEEIVGPNPYKASAIVGSNAWSDISTANYTETWLSARPALAVQPWASATFAPVPIPEGGVLTSLDFTAIVALANELNATGRYFTFLLTDMDYNEVAFVGADGNDYLTAPAADSNWYTMDFIGGVIPGPSWLDIEDAEPIDPAAITTLLQTGFRVALYRNGNPIGAGDPIPYDHMLRVAYLVGVCSWIGGDVTPPLRHTQRDDARNSGLNSRQRSLRNTGYL